MIANVFYWTGALVWGLAAFYGMSECALWCADKAIKRLGLWKDFFAVAGRYYRERRGAEWRPGA